MTTEPMYPGEFILSEGPRFQSRESIVIDQNQTILAGTVLGAILVGVLSVAAVKTGTGNGAITAPTVANGTPAGAYFAEAVSPTEFIIQDASGHELGSFATGAPFTLGGITSTVAVGGTAWVAGDQIVFTVTNTPGANASRYVRLNPAATDGSQNAAAIAFGPAVTGAGVTQAIVGILRHAEVKTGCLDWGTLSAPQIAAASAQLSALRILQR